MYACMHHPGFLADLWMAMSAGDLLMVGFDKRKPPHVVSRAYNDTGGVTAEFNLNLLRRINTEVGGWVGWVPVAVAVAVAVAVGVAVAVAVGGPVPSRGWDAWWWVWGTSVCVCEGGQVSSTRAVNGVLLATAASACCSCLQHLQHLRPAWCVVFFPVGSPAPLLHHHHHPPPPPPAARQL